jgi:hypothetical protein
LKQATLSAANKKAAKTALVALSLLVVASLVGGQAEAATATGGVVAWGHNASAQATVPTGLKYEVAMAAGSSHSLTLRSDGSVFAWGSNDSGQAAVPAGLGRVKAVAAGGNHSMALKEDGSVVAWGLNLQGQTTVPAGARSGVGAIAAGANHSLALDITPPAPVDLFDAEAGEERVSLSCREPGDSDFAATRILRSTTSNATSPTPNADQTRVYEGTAETFVDTNLVNGTTYHYTAYARDAFDHWSVRASARVTPRDTTAPETTITSALPRYSNSASASFQFTSSEPAGATFACSLDEAPFESCASGKTYENLEDDPHIFEVRATDAAGNVDPSPARRLWTVDTFAPVVTGVSPTGSRVPPTADVTATFSEAMTESTVEADGVMTLRKGTGPPLPAAVDYDPRAREATLNPSANLKRGVRYTATLTSEASDRAGNSVGNKSWAFTIKK